MDMRLVILAISAIALIGVSGCRDDNADRAEPNQPGLDQEAAGFEHAAETGDVARAARAVGRAGEQVEEQLDKQGIEDTAKKIGKTAEQNVDQSARVYDETYDKARAEGQNAVKAEGDAYNAVLDEPYDESQDSD